MIRVVEHDPAWASRFEAASVQVMAAAGNAAVRIHHIGSTAIPLTRAKPIIDMLLEVASLEALDGASPMLEALGYEAMGEFGIPRRRYFRLDDCDGTRTQQIHAFEAGVPDVIRHLAFRDYMRAHPVAARDYGVLKARLADAHRFDLAAYIDGKDAFVKEHERRALLWAGHRKS
jgi:GrpB-like predicted nucleotidyltransferase (UPF0157 family)